LPTDEWVDITFDLSSYKGDVNQLGIYVPEDRVAYFKNFELVGIGGVALDFTKALTTNSTPASMAVVQMGGEWCYKYGYSNVRTELGFDATKNETAQALLDGKTTLTFDLYMTSGSDALLNGSGLFTVRPKSASSNGYIWYNAKDSGKANAVIVYDEWQTVTVDLSQYGGDLTFLGIYFQNTVYLKNITLS
jgi:hypothetical protein